MPFFHGIQITDVANGDIIITQRGAGIIGLVGVSPNGPTGLTMVRNSVDAALFGPSVFDGRTIPHTLDAILGQGSAEIAVVNIFSAGTHNATITAEAKTVSAGLTLTLTQIPYAAPVITNSAGDTTLVAGTDYVWTPNTKNIKILNSTTYPATTSLKATYTWFDVTLVLAAAIVGGNTSGVRTGASLLELVYSTFGVLPKILIAPGYSQTASVSAALLAQAVKLRGRVIIDAPASTTIPAVIALRGGVSNFNTSNERMIGVFPRVYKPDNFGGGADQLFWYSAYFAGVWANVINTLGVQYSPSNKEILGISAIETPVSSGIGDTGSDAMAINAAGIVTVFSGFGTGIKTYGNRNFGFPSTNVITTFMSVSMVRDIVDESIELACQAYVDLPLNLAFIDTIKNSVNAFFNTLINSGALIDGAISYNPAKNPAENLAQGKVLFDVRFLPPGVAEDIEFESFVDISMFENLSV